MFTKNKDALSVQYPLSQDIDLDALNLLASGTVDFLCGCSYSEYDGRHCFTYMVDGAVPVSRLKGSLGLEDALAYVHSCLSAIELCGQSGMAFSNFKISKHSVYKQNGGFCFVYLPVAATKTVSDGSKAFLLEALDVLPFKHDGLKKAVKLIKKAASEAEAIAYAKAFLDEYGVADAPAYDGEEGETSVLSPDMAAQYMPETGAASEEGETSVLSPDMMSQYMPETGAASEEGETSVLSPDMMAQYMPGVGAASEEGETSVLSPDMAAQYMPETGAAVAEPANPTQRTAYITAIYKNEYEECETTLFQNLEGGASLELSANTAPAKGLALVKCTTGESFSVVGNVFMIGKDAEHMDLCLQHPSVSRHHATITLENGVYYIMDNKSTNGTTIEGVSLHAFEKAELSDGAIIALGSERLQIKEERN